jgi:hypothetical protein
MLLINTCSDASCVGSSVHFWKRPQRAFCVVLHGHFRMSHFQGRIVVIGMQLNSSWNQLELTKKWSDNLWSVLVETFLWHCTSGIVVSCAILLWCVNAAISSSNIVAQNTACSFSGSLHVAFHCRCVPLPWIPIFLAASKFTDFFSFPCKK